MGSMAAEGMVEVAGRDSDHALAWHLTSNHFPPLPVELVPVARRAIELADEGRWDERIELPEGVSYRGDRYAPVSAAVEAWHLDAFLAPGPWLDDDGFEEVDG